MMSIVDVHVMTVFVSWATSDILLNTSFHFSLWDNSLESLESGIVEPMPSICRSSSVNIHVWDSSHEPISGKFIVVLMDLVNHSFLAIIRWSRGWSWSIWGLSRWCRDYVSPREILEIQSV